MQKETFVVAWADLLLTIGYNTNIIYNTIQPYYSLVLLYNLFTYNVYCKNQ